MDILLFQFRFFLRRELAKKSLRVPLRSTALLLGRLVPDQYGLRLNRPDERVLTPVQGHRRAHGEAGGEYCDLKESTLHRIKTATDLLRLTYSLHCPAGNASVPGF